MKYTTIENAGFANYHIFLFYKLTNHLSYVNELVPFHKF